MFVFVFSVGLDAFINYVQQLPTRFFIAFIFKVERLGKVVLRKICKILITQNEEENKLKYNCEEDDDV